MGDVRLTYRDLTKHLEGASAPASSPSSFAATVASSASSTRSSRARVERSRTAGALTDANRLFEAGRIDEARAKLAARREELNVNAAKSLALVGTALSAAPRRAANSLERDFDDQVGAVAKVKQTFAPPPFGAGGAASAGVARPQAAREGKAQVQLNQQAASELGFVGRRPTRRPKARRADARNGNRG